MMNEIIDMTDDGTTKRLHDQLVVCVADIETLMLNFHDTDALMRERKLKSLRRLCYDVECQVYDKIDDYKWFEKLLLEIEACRDGIHELYSFINRF